MKNYNFITTAGTQNSQFVANLIANAPLATIAQFDVSNSNELSLTFGVTGAALTGVSVFGRGDRNAAWIPIPKTELLGYGRSDPSSSDFTTTPAGVSGMIAINATPWMDIMIQATSAGAATTSTTASVQ